MRFLSLLRVRQKETPRAPDPMQPGFDEEVFHRAFLAHGDGSAEDLNVRNFGVLIAARVGRIFATLEDIEKRSPRFTHEAMARAVVAFVHKQQMALFSGHGSALAEIKEITQEALIAKRTAIDSDGNAFTLDEVLEAVVDGVKHVLRRVHEKKGFGGEGDKPDAADIDAVAREVLKMGAGLEMLRKQWHAVLWGGARVFVDPRPPNPYAIDNTSSALDRMACVDLQRRQVVLARDARELTQRYSRHRLDGRRVLAWDSREAGERRLVVTTIAALPEIRRNMALSLAISHAAQLDAIVDEFLEESHPSLGRISYRKVLHAWYCLALLVQFEYSEAMSAGGGVATGSRSPVSCLPFEPLIGVLAEALDCQPAEARAVIGFLTYRGARQTPWERPLFKTKEGILPLWWPLQSGHLMRLVAHWGRADGKDDEKGSGEVFSGKGHRYEELIHLVLSRLPVVEHPAVQYLPLGPRLQVPDAAVGDVDAALIIEDTLFILECRAVGYPAEAFEFWNTHEELQGKINQVLRKKAYLASNPQVIASWVERAGGAMKVPRIERIIALVLSNSFLLEGERAEQPYFVHNDTLYNALLTGCSIFGGGLDEDGREIEYRVDFRGEGIAEDDAFLRALQYPAKAEMYKRCMTTLDIAVSGFDASDCAGVMRSPVMSMPATGQEVERILRRCGFAANITRVKAA